MSDDLGLSDLIDELELDRLCDEQQAHHIGSSSDPADTTPQRQ